MIIILGTPGAGKTTQTQLLADYLGCKWFSMGQLIRERTTGQDRQDMLAGRIISDETTLKIADEALATVDTAREEVIFEGNPRSIAQAEWWLGQAGQGRFAIKGVIHLVADPKVAEARMIKRGRLDDHSDDVIDRRFEEYQRSIAPTLNFLRQHNVPVHEVDANASIEAIAERIHQALGLK